MELNVWVLSEVHLRCINNYLVLQYVLSVCVMYCVANSMY